MSLQVELASCDWTDADCPCDPTHFGHEWRSVKPILACLVKVLSVLAFCNYKATGGDVTALTNSNAPKFKSRLRKPRVCEQLHSLPIGQFSQLESYELLTSSIKQNK